MAGNEHLMNDDQELKIQNDANILEQERELHRKRAEKFGVEYRDPARRRELKHESLKEKFGNRGFTTGFDFFDDEEVSKRQQRANRFNMPDTGLQWQPPQVPEDEEKKKQRAQRFGVEYQSPDDTGLMDVDLYEERKDAPLAAARRPEAIHVYGVDLLSTKDLLTYFADYGPSYVEWINDSSANIVFSDGDTAKRALAGLGTPLPPEELPEGTEMADVESMELMWHKGKDIKKSGSDIPVIYRMATVLDVRPKERVASRRLWVGAGGGGGGGNRGKRRGGGGNKGHHRYKHGGIGGGGRVVKGRGQRRFQSTEVQMVETETRQPISYDDL